MGLWRLRRKSWGVLHAKIEEEVMEGNILLKLREKYVSFNDDDMGLHTDHLIQFRRQIPI